MITIELVCLYLFLGALASIAHIMLYAPIVIKIHNAEKDFNKYVDDAVNIVEEKYYSHSVLWRILNYNGLCFNIAIIAFWPITGIYYANVIDRIKREMNRLAFEEES